MESSDASGVHAGYPMFMDLRACRVVVVGGGPVAERKVATLRAYGPDITVVAPEVTPELDEAARRGDIAWLARGYRPGDLAGARIAFCAVGDAEVEDAVVAEAHERNCPVNVVDVPDKCDFIVPSTVERGPLRIAVSTSGTAPTEAKRIRRSLERQFDASWEPYLTLMGQVRTLVKQRITSGDADRKPIFEAASNAGWRERLAAGEVISPEDAFAEACALAVRTAEEQRAAQSAVDNGQAAFVPDGVQTPLVPDGAQPAEVSADAHPLCHSDAR
jgi:precorrin-2 dehydrogenase/sirohydrochlorin ferrochelatase